MSDTLITAVIVTVLAAHVVALGLAFLRKRGAWLFLALNAVLAMAALTQLCTRPWSYEGRLDTQIVAAAMFEVLVLAMAGLAARGVRLARWGSWLAFALHFVASILAVAYALLFKIDRLI